MAYNGIVEQQRISRKKVTSCHVNLCDQNAFRFGRYQLNLEVDRLSSTFRNCCLATGDYVYYATHCSKHLQQRGFFRCGSQTEIGRVFYECAWSWSNSIQHLILSVQIRVKKAIYIQQDIPFPWNSDLHVGRRPMFLPITWDIHWNNTYKHALYDKCSFCLHKFHHVPPNNIGHAYGSMRERYTSTVMSAGPTRCVVLKLFRSAWCIVLRPGILRRQRINSSPRKQHCLMGFPGNYCAYSYMMPLHNLTGMVRKIQSSYFAYSQLTEIWMGEWSRIHSQQIVPWNSTLRASVKHWPTCSGCCEDDSRRLLRHSRRFWTAGYGEFHSSVLSSLYLLVLRSCYKRQQFWAYSTTPTSCLSTAYATI